MNSCSSKPPIESGIQGANTNIHKALYFSLGSLKWHSGRYLDGNNISGTLFLDEVLQSTGIRQNSNFKTLSLTKNNITAVRYNKNDTVTILLYIRCSSVDLQTSNC